MGLGSIVSSAVNRVRDVAQGAVNAVRSTVRTAESVAPTVSQLNSATRNITGRLLGGDPISDVTRTAARATQNLVSSTGNNVARGLFGNNPIRDLVDRGREFVSNQVRRVAGNAINNVVEAGRNFVGGIIDRGREFVGGVINRGREIISNVGNRLFDVGRTVFNTIREGVTGFVRSVGEGLGRTLTGIGQALNPAPLGRLFQGDFSGAWNDFKNNVSNGARNIVGGLTQATVQAVVDTGAVALSGTVSAIQTLTGLEPPSRGLTAQETAHLRSVYGDSIDYSQIRIKEGFLGLRQLMAAHTIGNTIYLPRGSSDSPASRDQLLIHETGHIWQYQNGGTDYIGESIWNQLQGALSSDEGRNAAYDYRQALIDRTPWTDLNPEQQASIIEDAYAQGLFRDPNARFTYDHDGNSSTPKVDYTDYVRQAIAEMRAGRGAA